jgi:SAM-dependent methyltransferase
MDLLEENILGGRTHTHWYYVSKGRALLDFLDGISPRSVLDVGAGSGVFSKLLLDKTRCASAVCVDPNYPQERVETHSGKPIEFKKSSPATAQDLVLMMDVLEHVDDDVGLLKQYISQMPHDGYVLITVPAFQFLWSGHDVFLQHRRRYTAGMLRDTLERAGLEPVKVRFFFMSLFPFIALMRPLKRLLLRSKAIEARSELKIYPNWLNCALICIHDIERHTLFRFNIFGGLSIFCLARKKGK